MQNVLINMMHVCECVLYNGSNIGCVIYSNHFICSYKMYVIQGGHVHFQSQKRENKSENNMHNLLPKKITFLDFWKEWKIICHGIDVSMYID